MTAINPPVVTFTGGLIGGLLHSRVDVPSYPTTADVMENCWPNAQGPLSRAPGMLHVDEFVDSTKKGRLFPFVFSTEQSYMIVATSDGFEFWINDGKLDTDSVTSTISDSTMVGNTTDLVQAAGITASATGTGSVANLKDSSTTTYWGNDATDTAWLQFDLGTAKTVRDIWIWAASPTNLQTKAPTAFTLQGSATGAFAGEQTTVLTVTEAQNNTWSVGSRRKFEVSSPGSYRYYRLNMTDKDGALGQAQEYLVSKVSMYDTEWFDNSDGNSSVTVLNGLMYLDADGGNDAVAEQRVTISAPNQNKKHILTVDVTHGPVNARVGTASGDNNVAEWLDLDTGIHYLEFTPTGSTVYIDFFHRANAGRMLNTVSFLSGTRFLIPHGYAEADLAAIHHQQIGDVLYMTRGGYYPRRLIRRGHRSWSFSKFLPTDGPFGDLNTSSVELGVSGTSGEITLTASDSIFTASDVGVLYSITGSGQLRTLTAATDNIYSDGVKITGVGLTTKKKADPPRTFTFTITGTFTGKIRLQRSSGNENNYTNYQEYTSAVSLNIDDNLDNQTWFYRAAVLPGEWSSGTAFVTIDFAGGSSIGIVRVISVESALSATAEVYSPLSDINTPVTTWKRGAWNATDGFPVSVSRGFGRLWFGRGIKCWGSVSDNFTSFEAGTTEEDDKSISVTLATPSSDGIRFLSFLNHLIIGTKVAEYTGLGNTTSEAVSPTNFQTLESSWEGSSNLMPVSAAGSVLYVHRNGRKLMQFQQDPKALSESSYISVDLNRLNPELLWPGVVSIAIQREPERRVLVVLANGTLMSLLFRREEEIVAWSKRTTDGFIEDVEVVQQDDADAVYLITRRKDGAGVWKRYLERLAPETVRNDEDHIHIDSTLSYELARPDCTATPSATTGTITITTDADAFVVGDVNSVLWINGGRGQITGYTSATQVSMLVWSELESANPASSGLWGLNPQVTSVTGASHLNGLTVRIFGDRMDLGTATVSGGSVTLPQACSVVHLGREFLSKWRSMKLSYGAQKGSALTMPKAIKSLGLLLYRCGTGFKYGHSFDKLRPVITRRPSTPAGEPEPLFSGEKFEAFDARYDTDSRVCFQWDGCSPGTISGYIPILDERDR